jgi:tetratricopeptide (TPR) repeat protein
MATSHSWAFRASFRRHAFGWRGTRKAIERLNEAAGEIERMARTDPALASEGAVLLLEKLSPAVNDIDSSSGALGSATAGVVEKMVPLIAAAPVSRRVREKWLERLYDAIQEDDPPYIESLGEHWGALCADPALASHWADQLLPLMQHVMADRRSGTYAYAKSGTLCYSALFYAGRFDELLAVLALDPKPYWHDQQWAAKALAARGDVDGAVNLMEGLRSRHAPDRALSAMAEQLLLDAGRVDEAYARYGTRATLANTNIATYRAIAKRYPGIEPTRILGDLIASTPGEEGKWFATAKTLKQYDLALALARRAPVDPKTLVRAARDHVKSRPAFALEVALTALHWMASGAGYELTGADVCGARDHALAAAETLGLGAVASARIAESVAGHGASARWVRQCLGLDAA